MCAFNSHEASCQCGASTPLRLARGHGSGNAVLGLRVRLLLHQKLLTFFFCRSVPFVTWYRDFFAIILARDGSLLLARGNFFSR